MKQYNNIKEKYKDAILLFRVGDFYETFGQDAIKCSELLDIALTKRYPGSKNDIYLAGFPYHALDNYLYKLIKAGMRVAICDQLEDSNNKTQNLVKRGVTELITPGVNLNDKVLHVRYNNFLTAIHIENKNIGLAFLDISTGEFFITECNIDNTNNIVKRINPSEIIYPKKQYKIIEKLFKKDFYVYALDDWYFEYDSSYEKLISHFKIKSLKCFKIENLKLGIIAAGVILYYLYNTCHNNIEHITSIRKMDEYQYMWIDDFTIRNLEINKSIRNNGVSLISILDKTITPMGSRLLKRWINFPLKEIESIIKRQNFVTELLNNNDISIFLSKNLKQISDIERLISKVATEKINPREVITLSNSLEIINKIKNFFIDLKSESNLFKLFSNKLQNCDLIRNHIINTLNDDYHINKVNIIARGVSKHLDELRDIVSSNKDYLIKLCKKEQIRTGINNIKIYYNNILGYFFEIRNAYKNKVPSNWIRKQTLVGSERYVNEELKNYELQILGAEKKIIILEIQLFKKLIQFISNYIKYLQYNAKLIAIIDVLHSFSICAKENNYNKPILDKSFDICIKEGRHPVIEKQIPIGDSYIPNNILLNTKDQQIIIITGPNMSGKSAILRQTAIIVLMAHIGSYVPAKYAKIGLIDRIFSRVGASDNISMGESTFMVEMTETAGILNNISNRSLIILDEIGRGTSTYDGISIAWAIIEYLHKHINRPKTLFATHYHELNKMMLLFDRIKNYNVSIKEINGNIIFLRKLITGGSTHSFGINVAKIAGMPSEIIKRSIEILKNIENKNFV